MSLSPYFTFASSNHLSQLCYSDLGYKHKRLDILNPHRIKSHNLWIIRSVLNSKTTSSINGNGPTEPARILLEKVFAQTQKPEHQIDKDPFSAHVSELGFNLVNLESDPQASLTALNKKEENLVDAEQKILSEYNDINLARKDLVRREEKLVAARLKQEKLEAELRLAKIDLASQATEIDDLKLHLKEKDKEISVLQSGLSVKEEEIVIMKHELTKKSDKSVSVELELKSMSRLVDEANKIVEKQNVELGRLHLEIQEKEEELENSITLQKSESEKLKSAESNLEKRAMDWLVAQEEFKKLADEMSKKIVEPNETREEIGRVRRLLSDVRSELVSSQKALASSRERLGDQHKLLEKQLNEHEEQRADGISYLTGLKDAKVEIESERVKLRLAETRNKELERDLLVEKEIVDELQKELDKERLCLEQAIQEISGLQEKIDSKMAVFEESQRILKGKESEIVEARVEIEHLISEQSSLQLILEDKLLELLDAKIMSEEVYNEILELKGILFDKEDELILAMSMAKDKDEHVETMEHEQSNAQLKFTKAKEVVEKIVNLTKEVVNDEARYAISPLDQENDSFAFTWRIKQLETELNFTRESLRAKEMENFAAKKDMILKDEELRMVLGKLDVREEELTELKDQMMKGKNDPRKLFFLPHEAISELAIQKLQLGEAQLEVEATTNALRKITNSSFEDYCDINLCEECGSKVRVNMIDDKCSAEVESEISQLLALTEQLVAEASIASKT